jgi:hypothetical protein
MQPDLHPFHRASYLTLRTASHVRVRLLPRTGECLRLKAAGAIHRQEANHG